MGKRARVRMEKYVDRGLAAERCARKQGQKEMRRAVKLALRAVNEPPDNPVSDSFRAYAPIAISGLILLVAIAVAVWGHK